MAEENKTLWQKTVAAVKNNQVAAGAAAGAGVGVGFGGVGAIPGAIVGGFAGWVNQSLQQEREVKKESK
jgi:hypothetical protein